MLQNQKKNEKRNNLERYEKVFETENNDLKIEYAFYYFKIL